MKELNGIDVGGLAQVVHRLSDADRAAFEFRTRTEWIGGGHSATTVTSFRGDGAENDGRRFVLEADEPRVLLGADAAPNPAEHLLHALATCLTASLIYHAAARGIEVRTCECTLVGELDVRGFLGLSPDARRGYRRIEARFRVESDAPAERLEELARFSPVLDVVTNGTEIDLAVETVRIPADVG